MFSQRKIVLDALIDVNEDFAYSNLVLQKAFKKYDLSHTEKAFITALFYGVIDRKITLDYVISKFVKNPVSKIKPITVNSLRMAVFQLMYMDSVPDSAAVYEAVKLVKASKENYNASFVNGVLRSFLRQGAQLPDDNSMESLSIRYSCPEWIIDSLITDYGKDNAVDILSHFLKPPKTTLRINTKLISCNDFKQLLYKRGITVGDTDYKHSVTLDSGIDFSKLNEYKEGLFHVQDLPSQIAVSKLKVKPGDRILDMCAAPGGKSFTVAEQSDDLASIVSCDALKHRVDLINKGAERLKLNSITCVLRDATVFDDSLGKFDFVICDVPCSGLGVIRRKPEIKYKSNLDFEKLETTQLKILQNGLMYLKNGGRLLYSTCTLRKNENENIVKTCLAENSKYELETEKTFLPSIDGTDGFYFAVIRSR